MSTDLLDTGSLQNVFPPAGSVSSSSGASNSLFNDMSAGVQAGVSPYTSQSIVAVHASQQQRPVAYSHNMGNEVLHQQQQYPSSMTQMTPYGMQLEAPVNNNVYTQPSMGFAGPGPMLQIQAPYAPQQPGDKFSAFDGL
ncbi:hypothetical protein CCR75_008886 [Bremia lactucae]|uniref:Uncharacterized protein n=1 Tax=Bremia lactucae TaxID=4779 RepID=A0A976FK94_BRELC|nr:hypothetical protein CCR75_008886 [Bremia lactucae]